jgi:hypothetical protein
MVAAAAAARSLILFKSERLEEMSSLHFLSLFLLLSSP